MPVTCQGPRHVPRVVRLTLILTLGVCGGDLPAAAGEGSPVRRLSVDRAKTTLTLFCTQASRRALLRQLEVDEGLRVFATPMEDAKLTLQLEAVPLLDGIARLLPDGTHFSVVDERGDLALPAQEGPKRGRKDVAREGLSRKDAAHGSASPAGPRKSSPEERPPVAFPTGKEVKSRPRDGGPLAPPGPKVAKVEKAPPTSAHTELRLRLLVSREAVRVESVRRVPGSAEGQGRLVGDHVWAALVDGTPVAVGSFRDPFELHSYTPEANEPHATLRAESGYVELTLPERVLAKDLLQRLELRFYRLKGAPRSPELTVGSFAALRPTLEELPFAARSEALQKALSGAVREVQP